MSFPAIRIWKCLIVSTIVPCLLAAAGCGGGGLAPLATGGVKGKVTLDGGAVPPGCKITFMHKERAFPATGDIGSDGTYTLLFNGKPEIPVGTYDVTIVPPRDEAGPPPDPSDPEAYKSVMMGEGPKKLPMNKEVFPRKYQDATKSQLTCTVLEGQEIVFDVKMTSGG